MPRCTRNGCGAEFTLGGSDVCKYHPGTPVFHEGLKSWSCCQHVNKPELDFEEFMKISGCTEAETHSDVSPQVQSPSKLQPSDYNITTEETADRKELFQVKPQLDVVPSSNGVAPATPAAPATHVPTLEIDDLTKEVGFGTVCRRKGCGITFVSNEVNRQGDGEGTVCSYHPLPPVFREGSKGYLCCKRRVLEFDEFMKIKGCKIGRHVFVPVTTESEEQVKCRIDHYQTRDQVHMTVYAKQVDKNRSAIFVGKDRVTLDLFLPGMKRFSRSLELFGDVDASMSSFQIRDNKVELCLQKSDARVWTILEKTDRDLGNINLTFGVGGKTGTVGAKEIADTRRT